LPAFGALHHTYSHHDTAADIARAGVEAGIALDKNSGTPITLYNVALQN
jgi:ATP-dependent HslUV protease, peptidase subunit HslV